MAEPLGRRIGPPAGRTSGSRCPPGRLGPTWSAPGTGPCRRRSREPERARGAAHPSGRRRTTPESRIRPSTSTKAWRATPGRSRAAARRSCRRRRRRAGRRRGRWSRAPRRPPGDELRDAVDGLEPLHVVLVAVEHQHGVAAQRLPQRRHVVVVAVVGSGAEAGPVPEGDAARARLLELALQPAELGRGGVVVVLDDLGVEAQDRQPATWKEYQSGGRSPCALPVGVVAFSSSSVSWLPDVGAVNEASRP